MQRERKPRHPLVKVRPEPLGVGLVLVINVCSIVASTGFNALSVYAATKASLVGFTKSLAREVGRVGVNVNAISPGFIDTEMTRELDGSNREQNHRPQRAAATRHA